MWARVQQRQDDRHILDAMLRLPLAITEHAACRMDCRCDQGGACTGLPRECAYGLQHGILHY